jgi:hypothetical protein
MAASSEKAILALEETLIRVSEQLKTLEEKNKTDMVSYKKLKFSFDSLQRKKMELLMK